MADHIYVVNPTTREPEEVESVSFFDIGVKERTDLEQWVIKHPELLGERLLVITSEYNKFDRSNRRLDVLALDADGVLVVIELKLDASRSFADLQAIRYAAFCSTITMDNLVEELADFDASTKGEASEKICKFLEVDELPTLGNRPRVILAAGSIDDQELTSCVLWLRSFGVDISCVELTPYRMPASPQIILVPRVIIPIPEAREYLIGIEQKEVMQSRQTKDKSTNAELWRAVTEEFNKLRMDFRASGKTSGVFIQVRLGQHAVHYEWILRKREARLDVAIHFEFPDRQKNLELLGIVQAQEATIKKDINLEFAAEPMGIKWAHAKFHLPFDASSPGPETAPQAAEAMKILIERTYPLIEPYIKKK